MNESHGDALAEFLRRVRRGEENALEIIKETLQDGKEKIVLSMQNRILQPEPPVPPARKESPPRAHVFQDTAGLAAYLTKYNSKNAVVFADVQELQALVVLDESAKQGFEVVQFQPQIHPLFAPWHECVGGRPMDVKLFALLVLRNRRSVAKPTAEELVLTFSQVRMSRRIDMQIGRGKTSLNGMMVHTEIQGQATAEPVDLPDTMTISVPIFVETEETFIELDLLLEGDEDGPVVEIASSDMLEKKCAAFRAMIEEIAKVENVVVALGHALTGAWNYLSRKEA